MQIEATDAFDLSPCASRRDVLEMYGPGPQARQPAFILAFARLLERGVRMVQVWYGAGFPWDFIMERLPSVCRQLVPTLIVPLRPLCGISSSRGSARRHAGPLGRRVRPDSHVGVRRTPPPHRAGITIGMASHVWLKPAAAYKESRPRSRRDR